MSIKSRTNFNESVVSTDSFSPNTSNMSTISKQNLNRLSTDNSTGASYDTSSNVQAIFAQAISKKPAKILGSQIRVTGQQPRTRPLTMGDQERLEECREKGKEFEIRLKSHDKKKVRDSCGLKTDHERHVTSHQQSQMGNDVIMNKIKNYATNNRGINISFLLFALHSSCKINNTTLFSMIKTLLITKYKMTIEEILGATYGDDGTNLLFAAAWNCAESCLRLCVGLGGNINYINKANENINDVLLGGYRNLVKGDKLSSNMFKIRYTACLSYIRDVQKSLSKPVADVTESSEVFSFASKKTVKVAETISEVTSEVTSETNQNDDFENPKKTTKNNSMRQIPIKKKQNIDLSSFAALNMDDSDDEKEIVSDDEVIIYKASEDSHKLTVNELEVIDKLISDAFDKLFDGDTENNIKIYIKENTTLMRPMMITNLHTKLAAEGLCM